MLVNHYTLTQNNLYHYVYHYANDYIIQEKDIVNSLRTQISEKCPWLSEFERFYGNSILEVFNRYATYVVEGPVFFTVNNLMKVLFEDRLDYEDHIKFKELTIKVLEALVTRCKTLRMEIYDDERYYIMDID